MTLAALANLCHMRRVAAVAQGQSTSLVRTGSVVRFHSAAPFKGNCDET